MPKTKPKVKLDKKDGRDLKIKKVKKKLSKEKVKKSGNPGSGSAQSTDQPKFPFEYVESNKKRVALYNSNTYSKRGGPQSKLWYCSSRQTFKCDAKIWIKDDVIEKIQDEHTHAPASMHSVDGQLVRRNYYHYWS